MAVGLWDAFESLHVPKGVQRLKTAGFSVPGRGAAEYRIDPDQASPNASPWRRRSANGLWFLLDESFPGSLQMGAKADGAADDTAALQALIDYCIYFAGIAAGRLDHGPHRTTDTVHIGYGDRYTAFTLYGLGKNYRGDVSGHMIVATKKDRPAVAVQGARCSRLRGVTIEGPMRGHIERNRLGTDNPSLNARIVENWIAPGFGAGPFNVQCAIAVDPYSGAAPGRGGGYPDVAYPSWLAPQSQYGKLYSSDVLVSDCMLIGHVAGAVVQPCQADGNGDFVRFENTGFEEVAFGISVGNTQSRLVRASYCTFAFFHTAVTNLRHGSAPAHGQAGKLTMHADSCEFRSGMQWFDLAPALAGPMTFTACYSESMWRLGASRQSGARAASLSFQGCEFAMDLARPGAAGAGRPNLGVPEFELSLSDGQTALFDACSFKGFWSVFNVLGGFVQVRGADVWMCRQPRSSLYEMAAHNGAVGGFLRAVADGGAATRFTDWESGKSDTIFDLDRRAPAFGAAPPMRRAVSDACGRPYGAHLYQVGCMGGSGATWPISQARGTTIDAAALSRVSSAGREITFTYGALGQLRSTGPRIGSLIRHDGSHIWFFVRAFADNGDDTATITAVAQNGFWTNDDGSVGFLAPFDPAKGSWTCYRGATVYCLDAPVHADAIRGSKQLTNVQRGDGAMLLGGLADGDLIHNDRAEDLVLGDGARLVAHDAKQASLTLDRPAERSQARKTITLGVRDLPSS